MKKYRLFLVGLLYSLCTLVTVTGRAQVTAGFIADHQAGCAPLIVHFTNTSTGATSYTWNLGNTNTSAQQDASASYDAPGVYTVTLTATNGSASNSTTMTVTVYGAPQVNFSAPTQVCSGTTVTFSNQTVAGVPGPVTYNWNFGDGGTSTAQNPSHAFSTPGFYNISLLATNSQGCDSLLIRSAYIHVLPQPVAAFTVNDNHFCTTPASAVFTSQGTASAYAWSFGDNSSSFSANPTHNYQSSGVYTVSLIITDANGCKDTLVQNAYISVGSPTASFTAPSGCAGAAVNFVSTSTPSTVQAQWSFGDVSSASGNAVTHTYAAAGTYNVQLTADDGSCIDTLTLPVIIHPNPPANFTFNPAAPCSAPVAITFTSTTQAGSSYAWSFSDGGTSTAANPVHNYSSYGIDSATLTVTNTNGCKSTVTQAVGLYDLYAVGMAIEPGGCVPFTATFLSHDSTTTPFSTSAYPYPVTSYSWNFGDGTPGSNIANPQHTYTTVGHFTAYVTITTSNGCSVTDSVHIATATVPPLTITAEPTHICADQYVTLHATPTDSALYTWYYGDNSSSPVSIYNDSVTTRKYMTPGIFHPYVIVSLNGCKDTVTTFNITIDVDTPTAQFTSTYVCDTLTKVTFINSSLGVDTYMWNFGDGSPTSTLQNPTHIYPALGSYLVQLISYNPTTGCHDTLLKPVNVHTSLPSFTANDTAVCIGVPVTYTSVVTGGVVAAYGWIVDGLGVPDSDHPSITDSFYQKGRHTIELVIKDDHNCIDSTIRNNYILVAQPTDSFVVSPPQGCLSLTVQFSDYSTDVPGAYITGHSWFFGDATSALNASANVTHTYGTIGGYGPVEIVTDNVGCKDTLATNINVYKPVASFTAATQFPCKSQNLQFSNTSTNAASDYWTFGDNTTSALVAPGHAYTQNGTYTVTLIVTDAHGCKDTMTKNAYLNVAGPTASFKLSDSVSICSPLIENLTNASANATSYHWDFGNNTTSQITNPSVPYGAPGNYSIQLIATDVHGCADTAVRNLKIYGYADEFSYTPVVGCSPLTVHFTANITNVPHITWDFSDGNVSSTTSSVTATHTYTVPGAYLPRLIISDSTGCSSSSTGTDTIKVDGIIGGFTTLPYPVCIYDTIQFADTSQSLFSPVIGQTWTFNNTTVNTLSSPFYYVDSILSIPVSLVVINGNGCKDTMTGNVMVHPLPAITVSSDTTICVKDSATLTAYGGISYVWSPAGGLGCIDCITTHASPASASTYFVKGTDVNGCANTDSVTVGLKTKTTDIAGKGGEICNGQSIVITDSGAQSYTWYPSAGLSNSSIGNPTAAPSYSITYMVVAQEGSCTPDTNYVNVIVHPLPTIKATAGNNQIIAGGNTDLLASGTNIVSFYWSPANLVDCDSCSRALAKLMQTTTFTVTGTTQYGCEDSDKVTVEVICDKSQLFIPNTFTPNGDGQNDLFFPRGVGLKVINSFRIYNRWGEKIFERNGIQLNDESTAWDGTIMGSLPKPDVYVYVVDGVCDNGSPISWKGDVTLIR